MILQAQPNFVGEPGLSWDSDADFHRIITILNHLQAWEALRYLSKDTSRNGFGVTRVHAQITVLREMRPAVLASFVGSCALLGISAAGSRFAHARKAPQVKPGRADGTLVRGLGFSGRV